MRQTRPDEEKPKQPRLEIGVDQPCHRCKLKGTFNDYGKIKECTACSGRGFISSRKEE